MEAVLDGGHPRRLAHRVYMFCTNGLRFLRTRWVPAIAVSVTYSKQEKAANTGSIPVSATISPLESIIYRQEKPVEKIPTKEIQQLTDAKMCDRMMFAGSLERLDRCLRGNQNVENKGHRVPFGTTGSLNSLN